MTRLQAFASSGMVAANEATPSILHHPRGQHLLADLHDISADKLSDPKLLEQLLRQAAVAAGAHILFSHLHSFGPNQGVTGVVLLAESHYFYTYLAGMRFCGSGYFYVRTSPARAGFASLNSRFTGQQAHNPHATTRLADYFHIHAAFQIQLLLLNYTTSSFAAGI